MKSFLKKTILLSVLFFIIYTDELPPEGSLTTVLNEENFDKLVTSRTGANDKPWFVLFYAPWCGHCKKLKPTWFKLGNEVKDTHNIGMMDCTTNKQICDRFSVRGYPTCNLILPSGEFVKFQSQRTIDGLKQFLMGGYKDGKSQQILAPGEGFKPKPKSFIERVNPYVLTIGVFFTIFIPMVLVLLCCCNESDDDEYEQPDINDDDDSEEEEENDDDKNDTDEKHKRD